MFRVVSIGIGLVLGLAAAGKLWLVATDPFADIKVGYPLFVLWLAILCEGALAYLNVRVALGLSRSYDSPASSLQPPASSLQPPASSRNLRADRLAVERGVFPCVACGIDNSLGIGIRFLRVFWPA